MTQNGASQESLSSVDKEVAGLIDSDLGRQNSHIHLIASENFASKAVMEASGSILTNKYSEGFPGRRYYEGCVNFDDQDQNQLIQLPLYPQRIRILEMLRFVSYIYPNSNLEAI